MPVPDFSPGEVLTAAAMDSIGLWLVGSGSLSLTTSATNVTGVFSSTYKNYRVLLNKTATSTTNRFDMKYIVGTTATSSSYFQGGIAADWASNTTIYMQRSANDPQYYGVTGGTGILVMDIFRPNAAGTTFHSGFYTDNASAYSYALGGINQVNAAFTGFQLFASTGTMTVEYQVFGYRD
jgi:hypothetical protein